MSLRSEPIGEIPAETARVARAAFPKGTLVTRLRDEFSVLYEDEDFRKFYPTGGQPALLPGDWPWSRYSSSLNSSATAKPPMPCAAGSIGSMLGGWS
jgi:hypothetical protein